MDEYPCDRKSCLIHPVYIEQELLRQREIQCKKAEEERLRKERENVLAGNPRLINNSLLYNMTGSITMRSDYVSKSDLQDLLLCVGDVSIKIQCILCIHLKKFDMEKNILLSRTKELLKDN
jgi:hypothetical protein